MRVSLPIARPAVAATLGETVPVFIDYQFVARYYEDTRVASSGF
jgi:hypothetical protein